MAYTRKFVILKKELGNMEERNLKGHSKLEVKGVRGLVTVNIENGQVDDFYDVEFIFKNNSTPNYSLGKIFTDGIGRGKGEYSFVQKDFKIEDVSGILIGKDENIFLGGYIGRENGRIEKYIKTLSKTPIIEEAEPEPEPEVIVEEISQEEPFQEEEGFPEEIIEEESWAEEPVQEEEEVIEEVQVEEEYYEEEDLGEEDDMEPDYKVIDHIKKINQKEQTTNYILSILRYFPYIEPFKHPLEGYNWWIVDLDKENEYKSFLPYFAYLTGGNNKQFYDGETATCNQLMDKYQHYIFGLYNVDEEVKYFVYGVPGSFKKDEHPNRGEGGFNTWYEGEGTEGYWIIYIDPMTGKVVYPVNPMNPME